MLVIFQVVCYCFLISTELIIDVQSSFVALRFLRTMRTMNVCVPEKNCQMNDENAATVGLLYTLKPAPIGTYNNFSWNKDDCSPNILVKEDDEFVFNKSKNCLSTDCIRGKYGFEKGIHAWDIMWKPSERGPFPILGVATSESLLHKTGVKILVGNSNRSWGWDLDTNLLYHNSIEGVPYPRFSEDGARLRIPEKVTLMLDMDEGTLSYIVRKRFLGIAFSGLCGLKLYPIVNVVNGQSIVRMTYWGCKDD